MAGKESVLKSLLDKEVDFEAKDREGFSNDEHDVDSKGFPGAIPLHCAAAHGRRLNGELLIAAKADLDQRNSDGEIPLWYAVVN